MVLRNVPAYRQVPPHVGVAGLLREENQQIDGREHDQQRVLTTVLSGLRCGLRRRRPGCGARRHRENIDSINRSWTVAAAYGAINPERIAYRTMLAVSWTPSFSRIRLRCESAVL